MAKLIVTGATRSQALARARRALQEFHIEGIASVLPFHRSVVNDPAFTDNNELKVHTRWIETEMKADFASEARPQAPAEPPLLRSFIELDGKRVSLGLPSDLFMSAAGAGGGRGAAHLAGPQGGSAASAQPGDVLAPITGSLVSWHKRSGDTVADGEVIAVMEAMKMETSIHATQAGVLECLANEGELLTAGQALARVKNA